MSRLHAMTLACMLLVPAACAAGSASGEQVTELPGKGPYQRFIVKFREGSLPARDSALVASALEGAARDAGAGGLEWLHRLGVGADVVRSTRPLDQDQARRLVERIVADPDVEYVEVDAMMRAGPGPGLRAR